MPATKALAIVTLAAATLGAPGCASSGGAGEFFGQVLGLAAAVVIESQPDDALFHGENDDFFHDDDDDHEQDHHREHRCPHHR